jgi:hypothetical protein
MFSSVFGHSGTAAFAACSISFNHGWKKKKRVGGMDETKSDGKWRKSIVENISDALV